MSEILQLIDIVNNPEYYIVIKHKSCTVPNREEFIMKVAENNILLAFACKQQSWLPEDSLVAKLISWTLLNSIFVIYPQIHISSFLTLYYYNLIVNIVFLSYSMRLIISVMKEMKNESTKIFFINQIIKQFNRFLYVISSSFNS